MREPATYRRYAEECHRLASIMPDEHRGTLLEIAEAWSKLADEAWSKLAEEAERRNPDQEER